MCSTPRQCRSQGKRGNNKKLIGWVEFCDLQASTRLIGNDGTVVKTACERCRAIFSSRKPPEEPDCESCRVELKAENEEAARIYQIVRGQKLSTGDLNHLAVWAAIDGYGIRNRVGTFEKVMKTFYHFLEANNGED